MIPELQENWNINNDVEAERAVRKIIDEVAECNRIIFTCQTFINEYQAKIEKAKEDLENRTRWLKEQLKFYFETVPVKSTKTQSTYTLPSGTLKLKFGTPEFIRDDDKLIEFLEQDPEKIQFIKIKKSPDWANFKKQLQFKDGKAITEDGEIVKGVSVVDRPDTFEVVI